MASKLPNILSNPSLSSHIFGASFMGLFGTCWFGAQCAAHFYIYMYIHVVHATRDIVFGTCKRILMFLRVCGDERSIIRKEHTAWVRSQSWWVRRQARWNANCLYVRWWRWWWCQTPRYFIAPLVSGYTKDRHIHTKPFHLGLYTHRNIHNAGQREQRENADRYFFGSLYCAGYVVRIAEGEWTWWDY